ncbi:DUF6158 family protein [Streptomyces sp. NPDC006487]|uniref:DUF6158 family protein n=1 Tax=Streptomyces sp. NPDC006487 TaxID=3364748 RepID=UPI0036767745
MAEREAREAGPSAGGLEEGRLMKELEAIHRTRHETLLHGSDDALVTHTRRMEELEREYVRRHPERAQTTGRTRSGARARTGTEEQG